MVLSVALVVSGFLYRYEKDNSYKRIILVWIVACLFLMLYSTVLGRLEGVKGLMADAYSNGLRGLKGSNCSNGSSVHLLPFWSIQAVRDGYIETLYEKIYNVLFFVPYGCLLGLKGSNSSSSSKGSKGMKAAVLIGFLTSVGIELLQLITRTGTCETDDVICNTLGCAVGAMITTVIGWSIGKIRNK